MAARAAAAERSEAVRVASSLAVSSRGSSARQRRRPTEAVVAHGTDLLIALDSGGTVLDTVTARHERGCIPAFIAAFGAGLNRGALAELWRDVNLRSRFRGVDRYRALAATLRIGGRHPHVGAGLRRHGALAAALEAWIAQEGPASDLRLDRALATGRAPKSLAPALEWSRLVDAAVAALDAPRPFPAARDALPGLAEGGAIAVFSSEPTATVAADWEAAGLAPLAGSISGRECGGKAVCLGELRRWRYPDHRVLVIGDSPVDRAAAIANGAAFFPIVPGCEEESWKALVRDFFPKFSAGEAVAAPLAAFLDVFAPPPSW